MEETGAKWNYVSYPSRGERAAALLGGHVHLYSTDVLEGGELIRSGRAKPLAALAAERLAEYPDLPTVSEVFPKAEHLALVRFVVAPKDVPAETLAYYEDLMRRVTETEDWKDLREKFGLSGAFIGAQETADFATNHRNRIRQFSVDAGIAVVR